MSTLTHDTRSASDGSRVTAGLLFAVVSAVSFALSGVLARPLLDSGWSPGAVVLTRVAVGALVVAPIGLVTLRGRWRLLRRNARLVLMYGLLGVAGAQFCFFAAVARMQVGPALMIEYTAPAAVVLWLWLRHGQRPGPVTIAGAGLAALGLVLVLDLVSGPGLDPVGVLWALGAMVGLTGYFVISADEGNGLPPMTLAAGGLVVGTTILGGLAVLGLLPMQTADVAVSYAGRTVAWWVPLIALGLVTAALAYSTGIAAGRRLGSRLASFVALLEVVAAIGFAWLLLDELPHLLQLVGGLLVLAGVVVVKRGERQVESSEPSVAVSDPSTPGLASPRRP
jgi:drug/metabolite transporter (DMT)-like permease